MVLAIVLRFAAKAVKASDMAPLPVQVTEVFVQVTEVLVLVTEVLVLATGVFVLAMALLVSATVPEMVLLVQDMVPVTALLVLDTMLLEKAMALAMVQDMLPLVAVMAFVAEDMAVVLTAMVTWPEVLEPFLRISATLEMVASLTRSAPTLALEITKTLPIFHLEACSTLPSASVKLVVSIVSSLISPMEEDSQALVALVAFLTHLHKTKRYT